MSEQSVNAATSLAREAARSRRDARAPRIEVRLEGDPVWPPLTPSDYGDPQPLGPGSTYRIPRDQERLILVRQALTVFNHEPFAVRLQASQIVLSDQPLQEVSAISIPPGASVTLLCQGVRTVSSWIEVAQERANGSGGSEIVGMLWHSDSYDDGVVDYWEVRIGGCPVVPIPDDAAGWMVMASWAPGVTPPLGSGLMPRRRRYFLSKADNRELDPAS